MSKISVLMSVYNEPIDWISESIRSIAEQDITEHNIQLIVIVDNPSKRSELETFFESFYEEVKHLRGSSFEFICHYNIENIGLAKSLNKAFSLCDGDFIARMDADDISNKNRFSEQIKYIVETNSDIIGSGIERVDEFGGSLGVSLLSHDFNDLKNHLGYKSICYHPTWLMKRHVFESINGYRPYPNSQDLDFLIRAVEAGYTVRNAPLVLLKYRLNDNSLSFKKSLRQRKCQEHILKLATARSAKGKDSYSEGDMHRYIKSNKLYEYIHAHSQKNYVYGMNLIRKKHYSGFAYVVYSMIVSPMQSKYIFSLVANKLRKFKWIKQY
ncbi:glycosyltransferase [Aeromonas caviae]|uniref:glycosyltransferase n=2 Tax=Aeromonas caviae TaxID=648 RepID=UPI002B46BF71|nr:glycosyltransferase [Aeromonas caviae]